MNHCQETELLARWEGRRGMVEEGGLGWGEGKETLKINLGE